jgi:hypothetical protein
MEWLPAVLSGALRGAAGLLGLRRVVKLLETSASEAEAILQSARFVPMSDLNGLRPDIHSCAHRRDAYAQLSRQALPTFDRILQFDQQTYLPSLLSRLDKTSMAAGVECRVPFLDNEVIDCSQSVPEALKIRVGRENKVALKAIAATMLPRDLVYRRKVGFGTPLAAWLRNATGLGRYVELLLDRTARDRGYVDGAKVSRLVAEHREGRVDHSEVIWSLLALELWCRTVVDPAEEGTKGPQAWSEELSRFQSLSMGPHASVACHSGMTV